MSTCPNCKKTICVPKGQTFFRCPYCNHVLKYKQKPTMKEKKDDLLHQYESTASASTSKTSRQRAPSTFSIPEVDCGNSALRAEVLPPVLNTSSKENEMEHRKVDKPSLLDTMIGWFLFGMLVIAAILWVWIFGFGLLCLTSGKTVFHDMVGVTAVASSLQAVMLYTVLWKMSCSHAR